jgi:steroid delta-isomerase
MPSREEIQTAIESYIDAVGRHDLEATVACFAEDAVQEDPIGTPPNVGRAAIREFFERVIDVMHFDEDAKITSVQAIVD